MNPEHPSAERLQAFLEGELSESEGASVEAHVAGCARCSAELEAWRVLLEDLDGLPGLRPAEDFGRSVMASVDTAALAAQHVDALVLQEYLDGALNHRAAKPVESHLAACEACEDEARAWATLIGRLDLLGTLAPSDAFADRVMARVRVPAPLSLAARVHARVVSMLPSAHPTEGRLQDLVEGTLGARRSARVHAHVAGCDPCASEVQVWRGLFERLGSLERFDPSPGFAQRVVARIRRPVAAVAPSALAVRLLASARRFVPRTRRAWAAISGVAVTPAVSLGLVLYVVFSHPTLTPGALASFLWWQVADLGSAAWGAVGATVLESAELFGVYSFFEMLVSAPLVVAGGALLYTLVSAVSLRVLYKNLIANRPLSGPYVRARAS